MIKFYFSTATCSLACHIVLEELGIPYAPVEVSFRQNINLEELERVNPLGAVPVLILDDGKALTQNTAILEYLADLKPSGRLLAERGTWERTETMSWVAFVASDLQRAFSPIFVAESTTESEAARQDIRQFAKSRIQGFLAYIEQKLAGKDYIMGPQFTIADAYLFTILGWTKWVEVSTLGYPQITAYMKRVFDRPVVQKVLAKEDCLDYLQE